MVGARGLFAVAAALSLCGCSSVGDYFSHNTATPQIGPSGVRLPDKATKTSEKIVKLPANASELSCPEVDIADGGATARVGGPTSQEVRYQFDINDVARECDPQGGQFALKVGVSGRLLLGPAGSPGSYSTTLHVQVKRDADGKYLFDKTFPVSANTEGDSGAFRLVTDPILLPLTRARLNEDYSIVVGLGSGGGAVMHSRKARRRG